MSRVALILGLVASRVAFADPPAARPKVGIVPGIAVNLDAARVDALGQDLADALAQELAVDAIGGLEVRRLLPQDGVAPDCVTTPSCVADVAARLGASQLIFVVMVDTGTGGAIQVDSTWVDAATGRSASRPPIDITAIGEATARFAAAARQLLPDAPARMKAPAHEPIPGPVIPPIRMPEPRHFTTRSYVTAGVAGVGLAVGLIAGLSARSHYNDCLDKVCTQDAKDSIRHRTQFADGGWVLAIGGAVATTILFATSGYVAPSPEGVTVGMTGRF